MMWRNSMLAAIDRRPWECFIAMICQSRRIIACWPSLNLKQMKKALKLLVSMTIAALGLNGCFRCVEVKEEDETVFGNVWFKAELLVVTLSLAAAAIGPTSL